MRSRSYVILAILCAACAGLLSYGYLASLNERTPVVVAARDIKRGTVIEPSLLRTALVHPSALHPQAFESANRILGQCATAPIYKGEQIVSPRITGETPQGEIGMLPPDQRAFLVPVPLSRALGGLLGPGDLVDVIFVSDPHSTEEPLAQVLLTELEVLDTRSDRGISMEPGEQGGFLGAVLCVTPPEAEMLAYALTYGHIYIAGRGYLAGDVPTAGSTWRNLLSTGGAQD